MPDSVTVTTTQSWPSRLAESIKSVIFGVLIFIVAFPLLFWNEGRAVKTRKSLEEGAGAVVSVNAEPVEARNEGKLVHVSGFTSTDDQLRDETFGIAVQAIRLKRNVEMYQWVESKSTEKETKLGGSEETKTTYSYEREWSSRLVDSDAFQAPAGHENPKSLAYESRTVDASGVTLGGFTLSSSQISQLDRSEPLPLTELPAALKGEARLQDGRAYFGSDPASPAVGDLRVRFAVVPEGPVSVVARQVGSGFEAYLAEAGGSILMVKEGVHSAESMFDAAQAANTMTTWILRAVGFFMMFFGLATFFRPIAVFGDLVPLVGRLLGAGVGLFAGLIAAFCSLVTIAVSWIVFRPLLGISILLIASGALYLLFFFTRSASRQKQGAGASVPPPPPIPTR